MSEAQSIAARKRMAQYTPEELSARMRSIALKRMKALTPRQRKNIARRLLNSRLGK